MTRRQVLARGAAGAVLLLPGWQRIARAETLAPPRGVHLSFTQDPRTTTTATWFTDGLSDPGTVVEFGPAPAGMSEADLASTPFEHADEGTADATPGVAAMTHRATLTGLEPGERVRYRAGRPDAWSPVRTFSPGPADRSFTFAHVGDHGTTPDSASTIRFLEERRPDLVLVAGDLSYANGDQPVWDDWFGLIEPVAAGIPLMAAPGNHENEDDAGVTFKSRLSHPGAGSYYAFDVGNIAVVVSTAGVFLEDGRIVDELVALDRALADAALRRALGEIDFIAVMQHYPLWTNHESRGPLNPTLVVAEEQILQRHQVDLLLVGHDHFYERSKPMAYGQVVPHGGYVEVISGGGGKSLYDFVAPEAFQSWSAAHAKRFHVVLYEVDGPVISAQAVATDVPGGEVLDTFEVHARPHAALTPRAARSRAAIAATVPPVLPPRRPGLCEITVAGAAGD